MGIVLWFGLFICLCLYWCWGYVLGCLDESLLICDLGYGGKFCVVMLIVIVLYYCLVCNSFCSIVVYGFFDS